MILREATTSIIISSVSIILDSSHDFSAWGPKEFFQKPNHYRAGAIRPHTYIIQSNKVEVNVVYLRTLFEFWEDFFLDYVKSKVR